MKARSAGAIVKPQPLSERDFQRQVRRFMSHVDLHEGCWDWMAARTPLGYGQFVPETGQKAGAHRWLYEALLGPVPEGLELDHLCRRPMCVNPAHLEPVTHAENCRRGDLGGHSQRERTHCPKGHPYSGDNLIVRPEGWRACRECGRTASRERWRRLARAV